ncbi:hypothetical protein PRUB_a2193 [Pseudoalteromonas rubra]|uniref:Uncharacterized protein n=1 Tax=Pseudoalteromonas rubra TaxID=43658 RepID=A0A8T0CCE4_9GAMM|nr:hypothetical protein PRUB_a2193 [Pseudoalteromonas rubra]
MSGLGATHAYGAACHQFPHQVRDDGDVGNIDVPFILAV